ncbi:hypothetical protein BC827DRAFT_1254632 [Russula dissimulans]|nr:hypothetical protein BC827DRAFT_1254632 [Russula dissimulans]
MFHKLWAVGRTILFLCTDGAIDYTSTLDGKQENMDAHACIQCTDDGDVVQQRNGMRINRFRLAGLRRADPLRLAFDR